MKKGEEEEEGRRMTEERREKEEERRGEERREEKRRKIKFGQMIIGESRVRVYEFYCYYSQLFSGLKNFK